MSRIKGLSLTDLGCKSVRRNALVSDFLHRIDFVEKAGTGIRRIRDEASARDCPEPQFESNSFGTVIFRPNPEVRAEAEERPMDRVAGEVRLLRPDPLRTNVPATQQRTLAGGTARCFGSKKLE